MSNQWRWWLPGMLVVVTFGVLSLAAAPPDQELPPPRPTKKELKEPVKIPDPPASILDPATMPITLPASLKLAGVENPEIQLAQQRVLEAVALRQLAAAQLLPDLNAGTSFDNHTGNLQQANGTILNVNRGSMYAGLGSLAVAAGTVNIPGVLMQGNVSDSIFGILVANQRVKQLEWDSQAVRNDMLLRVATAYVDLLHAEGHRAIALQTRGEGAEVARVTAEYAATGQGRPADADRAAADLAERDQDILNAENEILVAAARLAQVLNLDPSVRLFATDGWVVPKSLVPEPIPLKELIAIAMVQRPELAAQQAAIRGAFLVLHGAKVLPFSPNLPPRLQQRYLRRRQQHRVGRRVSANGVPVNQPRFGTFDDRQDVDVVLYWTLRNLGIGNLALINQASAGWR